MPALVTSSSDPMAALRRAIAQACRWLLGPVLASAGDQAAQASARPAAGRATVADTATLAAFQRLMLPHLDAAYALARYLTRDATISEDIVQEAYLRAFHGFAAFRGGEAKAWILAIVRNGVRDWQARDRRERRLMTASEVAVSDDDDDLAAGAIEAIACDVESIESQLVRDGEDRRVRAVIERLPDPMREILVLREMQDLSYREIAQVAQLPIGTVMSRLARAREAFAAIWLRLEREERP